MEPLSLVPARLWAHAVLMVIACMLLLPLGISFARRRAIKWHMYTQYAVIAFMNTAACLVMVMGTDEDDSASHLRGVVAGEHEHSSVHSLLGLGIITALVLQTVTGCIGSDQTSSRAHEYQRVQTTLVHRIVGYTLTFVCIPLQLLTGVAALFQVCDSRLSGDADCVGHIELSVLLGVTSLAYFVVSTYTSQATSTAVRRFYYMFLVENVVALVIGFAIMLHSLYAEQPLTDNQMDGAAHFVLGGCLLVGSGLSLVVTLRRLKNTQPLPSLIVRAIPLFLVGALAAVVGGVAASDNTNVYGRTTHQYFAALMILAGATRAANLFRLTSFLFLAAAPIAFVSQRGFQLLYVAHYAQSLSIVGVIVLCLLFSILAFTFMAVYTNKFFLRTHASGEASAGGLPTSIVRDDSDDDEMALRATSGSREMALRATSDSGGRGGGAPTGGRGGRAPDVVAKK